MGLLDWIFGAANEVCVCTEDVRLYGERNGQVICLRCDKPIESKTPTPVGIDRRQFIRRSAAGIAGAAALAAIDPELLTWQPGEKTVFFMRPAPEAVPTILEPAKAVELARELDLTPTRPGQFLDGRLQAMSYRFPSGTIITVGGRDKAALKREKAFLQRSGAEIMHAADRVIKAEARRPRRKA